MSATNLIESRQLGSTSLTVFPLALGCMGMSGMYGSTSDDESIATIHAALDSGVTMLDTGDFYGCGHNEMLIGRAIQDRRNQAILSVKFGALRSPEGGWIGVDGRPESVKNFAAYSLNRLGVDCIDIYRLARLDPNVPIEDTIGAMADLVQAGYVRYIGLSEVGVETIRRAHAIHPISDLQIEYSLISRKPETTIFPVLEELGIGVTAYGVLSRGLLSGSMPTAPNDFRAYLPRFSSDNLTKNQHLIEELKKIAVEKGTTPSQIAIAWVLAKSKKIIPLIGARKRSQLSESLAAVQINLSPEDITQIENAIPAAAIAGTRYDRGQMNILDSER
jgi:aryl-alcohol dehydrogenase-like predicted oxidoreductase